MAEVTIFQHWIATNFIYPFFLMFALVFAILEKTKILGEDKKQLNAIIAFVIGMIFVSAVYPKVVVSNLILFLTVAIVIVFVALILWGFVAGEGLKEGFLNSKVKWIVGIVLAIVMVFVVLWATGIHNQVLDLLFRQPWSNTFWTNFFFIVVVAAALALVLTSGKKG